MFKQQIGVLLLSAAGLLSVSSCKKDVNDSLATNLTNTSSEPAAAPGATTAQLNQTAYQQSQDFYLWNTQLPATFDGNAFADPAAVMASIRRYSTEPGFSAAVDRWSFAMKKTEWDAYSGGMSTVADATAEAGDFGMTVFFRSEGDLRVRLTEPYSPAGIAGVKRGWRILSINGNANITTSNATSIVNNVYNSTSSSFVFRKPDGSAVNISLNASHYSSKPVYMDTVYNTAAGRVGYLVYNSFLGNMSQSAAEYARVFNRFGAAGVSNLIIDLRYNGGGYVHLQEQLANYIISNAGNGGMMMKQIYNTAHSSENVTSYFHKAGTLNLNRVYFIVSQSTASASELLINNLKPYMDVRLIGTSNTHGKPVGFFPIENGEWYSFPVSFKTVNKNNEGNYYSGFAPDALVADGLDKDWGDVSESSLASALRNIGSGSYRGSSENVYTESPGVTTGNAALEKNMLKITIAAKK